ncbi:calcium-dependent protein kinase 4 [Tanacetum coccineum]
MPAKSISKRKLISKEDLEDAMKEILLLHHLARHKNMVTIKGVYEDPLYVHIVMEHCNGGELFDRIIHREQYTEKEMTISLSRHLILDSQYTSGQVSTLDNQIQSPVTVPSLHLFPESLYQYVSDGRSPQAQDDPSRPSLRRLCLPI